MQWVSRKTSIDPLCNVAMLWASPDLRPEQGAHKPACRFMSILLWPEEIEQSFLN